LLAPFQKVSENRLHKLHKTNDRISSIWPFQNVYLEVHPFGETVRILTVRRWLKNDVHFVASAADSFAVGEAETGSGGDQPVKE
jgi:hypothetical protein